MAELTSARRPSPASTAMIHRSLVDWDDAGTANREAAAWALVPHMPQGTTFAGLRRCALGGAAHEIAIYRVPDGLSGVGRRFALVPGGPVRLGFDPARGWMPTPALQADWDASAVEWGLPPLHEHLPHVLAPPRDVTLPPLLVEVEAREVGWADVDPDDPEVRALLATHGGAPQITQHGPGDVLRVTSRQSGPARAERADGTTQADLLARLARDGWRLPDPDEWEHLCAGGSSTLWRWGDNVPHDAYPSRPVPEGSPPPAFDAHQRPNAFGLTIAADPYFNEVTAAPGLTRGGDGGCSICGGVGILAEWLVLATAYCDPAFCEPAPEDVIDPGYTIARRVWPLD